MYRFSENEGVAAWPGWALRPAVLPDVDGEGGRAPRDLMLIGWFTHRIKDVSLYIYRQLETFIAINDCIHMSRYAPIHPMTKVTGVLG